MKETFSWQMARDRALMRKLKRNKILAKLGEPHYKTAHPDWVRDATADNPNYTLLVKKVKEDFEKSIKAFDDRIKKQHG